MDHLEKIAVISIKQLWVLVELSVINLWILPYYLPFSQPASKLESNSFGWSQVVLHSIQIKRWEP